VLQLTAQLIILTIRLTGTKVLPEFKNKLLNSSLSMKNLLLVLLFLPMIAMSQEDAFGPQKKDNLIIITTDTIDRQALNKAVKTLIDNGFTIKETKIEKGTIITDPYDYKKGKLTLNILIALNEIKIWGDYEPNLALISGADKPKTLKDQINFEGTKDSAVKEAWNIMDSYANQLTQVLKGSVSYAKW
jgi:hypothetical protein